MGQSWEWLVFWWSRVGGMELQLIAQVRFQRGLIPITGGDGTWRENSL
jgi:hypothetical protein